MNENLLSSLSEETNRELEKDAKKIASREARSESLKRDYLAEDFRTKIDNIYEAIIVLSQRARQIGHQQARIMEQFLTSRAKPDAEEGEEVEPVKKSLEDDDEDGPKYPRFEKPTILSMNELEKDILKYNVKE